MILEAIEFGSLEFVPSVVSSVSFTPSLSSSSSVISGILSPSVSNLKLAFTVSVELSL